MDQGSGNLYRAVGEWVRTVDWARTTRMGEPGKWGMVKQGQGQGSKEGWSRAVEMGEPRQSREVGQSSGCMHRGQCSGLG